MFFGWPRSTCGSPTANVCFSTCLDLVGEGKVFGEMQRLLIGRQKRSLSCAPRARNLSGAPGTRRERYMSLCLARTSPSPPLVRMASAERTVNRDQNEARKGNDAKRAKVRHSGTQRETSRQVGSAAQSAEQGTLLSAIPPPRGTQLTALAFLPSRSPLL